MSNQSASRLGNLFGNASSPAENNDSLKYTAPREPKKNAPPVISAPLIQASNPAIPKAATPASTAPQSTPGASKVIASAAVRLYKYLSTGYEPQAGGSPLGCVLVGSGVQYQILIYNAQKVPQATALISPTFSYNLRDLYVSFSDSGGNNWSILFDTVDSMTSFVRTLVSTMCHVRCHQSNEADQTNVLKCALPPSPTVESDPSLPSLVVGMSAGVSYRAWEVCGSPNESPTEATAYNPFLQSPPNDFAKIKVGGSSEDPIGGMGAALVGCQKGDRLILGIPTGIAYNNASGDMTGRKRPGMWVIVEIEIAKVKSDKDKKEKKKEKKADPEPEPERSSLSSRMANLSHQAGAGVLAAMTGAERRNSGQGSMMESQSVQNQQQQPQYQQPILQQQQPVQQPPQQQYQQPTNQYQQSSFQQPQSNPNSSYVQHGYSQAPNQNYQQQQQQQQQPSYPSQSGYQQTNFQQNSPHNQYPPQQQNYQQQSQSNLNTQYMSQSPQQSYALTLVEGQEARSYYVNDDSTASYVNQRQQQQHQQQPIHQSHLNGTLSSSPDIKKQTEQLSQIQQTMISIHSSLLGLHGKVDILSSSSSSSALSMPFGFNSSFQQQLQQQQLQQMMLNMNNPSLLSGNAAHTDGSFKTKGKQLVDGIAEMVSEYDRATNEVVTLKSQLSSANSLSLSNTRSGNQEQTISRLEEKIETLMNKNEKLMNEKSELYEKNSSTLDQLSELNSKYSRLQRELDSTRRERDESEDAIKVQRDRVTSLRMEIERLKDDLLVANSSSSKSSSNTADKELIASLQLTLNQVTSERNDLNDRVNSLESQHQATLNQLENEWSLKLDNATSELRGTIRKLQDEHDEKLFQQSTLMNKEKQQLEQTLQLKITESQELEQRYHELKNEYEQIAKTSSLSSGAGNAINSEEYQQLHINYQKLENENRELQYQHESLQQKYNEVETKYVTIRDQYERLQVDHEDLHENMKVLKEKSLENTNNGNNNGFDQEKVNILMQNIYTSMVTIFPNSTGAGDSDDEEHVHQYTAADILKRCRKVLKQAAAEFIESNTTESV